MSVTAPAADVSVNSMLVIDSLLIDSENCTVMSIAVLTPDEISIRRADPDGAQLLWIADQHAIAAVIYGGYPLADALADGSIRLVGDLALAERYIKLFPLPSKLGVE